MEEEKLLEYLEGLDHSKDKRQQLADLVLDRPELVGRLLDIASSANKKMVSKACWVIEYTARQNLDLIFVQMDRFISILPKLHEESSIRPMAKICEMLVLRQYSKHVLEHEFRLGKDQLENMATICFDWLIGDHKVATKAFSMTCLYHIGKSFSWIHPELELVLEQNYTNESAAYKARARHILPLLKKSNR